MKLDNIDSKILRHLQQDSSCSVAVLADEVGLSASACHRRVKLLEEAGIISGYAAKVDRRKLGLNLQVFVEITLASQANDALDAFEAAVNRFEDILECHLTTGEADYILRICARDVEDYDRIHRHCLSRLPGVTSMKTTFAMRSVKSSSAVPISV